MPVLTIARLPTITVVMPFVKVGTLSGLPGDSVMEVAVGGEFYAVCNAGGSISALGGRCPHHGGPLGQGQIHEGRVVCPWHMWEFDCRTGEYDYHPAVRVATHEVRVEGDDIFLKVP